MARSRIFILGVLLSLCSLAAVVGTSCGPDKCSVVCLYGGTCSDKQCVCPIGHSGTNCQVLTFLGNWQGTDNDLTISTSYTQYWAIARSNANPNEVVIGINSGFAAGHVINGTFNADSSIITYTKQLIPTSTTPDTVTGRIVLLSTINATNNYTYSNSHDGIIYTIEGNYRKN